MKMARVKYTGTSTVADEPISGLTWKHREVKLIPLEPAQRLVAEHRATFKLLEVVEVTAGALPPSEEDDDRFDYLPPNRLDLLDRESLVQLAMAKFGRALDAKRAQPDLVQDVRGLYEEHKFRRVH